jgi:di/tricarboxylate transporter
MSLLDGPRIAPLSGTARQLIVLVLGYGYGYFRHTDLIRIGLFLTVVDFVILSLSVAFYWPLLGL